MILCPSAHSLPGVLFLWSTVSMLISSSPLLIPPPALLSHVSLCCLSRSSLWHAIFMSPTTITVHDSSNRRHLSVILWWYFRCLRRCVCAQVCVREKGGEAPDCAVCLCAAGLVCMKSSTSVVELVMLLCSQVGSPSASALGLCVYRLHTYDPLCSSAGAYHLCL